MTSGRRTGTAHPPVLGAPVPEALAARPTDERTKLPIPVVNEHTDADGLTVIDFIGVNHERAAECAEQGRCGLCGRDLDYYIAFLGGPKSAEARSYSDPPMHEQCAVAALTLCPHLRIKRHRRAPDHRLLPGTSLPHGWADTKPDTWVLGITRDFRARYVRGSLIFFPYTWRRLRIFNYTGDNESLVEVTE